jgi:hypothetical protein
MPTLIIVRGHQLESVKLMKGGNRIKNHWSLPEGFFYPLL